jgi:hypothetical protein
VLPPVVPRGSTGGFAITDVQFEKTSIKNGFMASNELPDAYLKFLEKTCEQCHLPIDKVRLIKMEKYLSEILNEQ